MNNGECISVNCSIEERVVIHNDEERLRKAGPHTVADIHCANCREHIGYRYVRHTGKLFQISDNMILIIKKKLFYFSDFRPRRGY